MNIPENKYHSTIKLEFRDLVDNIVSRGRKVFHVYTIHRLLSLGLLIDFRFAYIPNNDGTTIIIELDLKEHGNVRFSVNAGTNYGSVLDDVSMKNLTDFLANYNTKLDDIEQKGTKLFDK
ncbi:hypothetical protein Goe27_00530 [Bacillus phage vB_BsuM-Goe27]|uniref:Uncharacterized protein n=1 Tax=Bacillus phage vB_BsuM-Goe3 TaxID=1933063 RepID=A0A217ER15_BPGO3|nr:hypothetical protein HWB07_gp052 [Bacillus phage vB_BsuM-Goe3]AYJ75921.1 hypothetical protein BSP14_046 [Bacillus phage BSP14]AYJ76238.1 hypothetical protein BSP12_052 [Bacillus phage BSP12]QDP43082.1 hypothetical protein Goe7_c00520 [Bacillus phage vB_BveM-Goe7]UJJ74858.1 hypothetical protein [Bacillus phage BM-P1]WCS68920.1 hypothetical protein Goe17_00560 [Bacillus phage vB_BsuM-Goe17]WCS69174.1 hypothetical protein Goe20_00520 [Bacillus phage vB_BsuM-Goe20]WCS69432.1 hypothetical prot